MEQVLVVHARLATALILYLAALGAWGIGLGLMGSGPSPAYRGALVIAELAVIVQGLAGIASIAVRGPEWIHVLYGAALAVSIPLAATIVRQGSPRRTSLTLGLVCLFAAGLAIRGMTTA